MSPAEPIWCVIAGGGTAGHVHPGLAIAAELQGRGHPAESILFVGSQRGVDSDLVPEAGFELVTLPGRGIQRRLTFDNVGAILGLLTAFLRAMRLLGRRRPRVVVSLGGYASVPCGVAALFLRIPVVVAEQNAVPGAANRLVSRWARAAAVSFPDTALRRAEYTGNPVRSEILAVDRSGDKAAARKALGVGEGRQFLCCYGGSLGAGRINQATADASAAWSVREDLSVRHVLGTRDWEDHVRPVAETDALEYRAIRYENDMPSVLASADLLLCRAGASTVAELTVTGAPAILVPLPGAPGDHQTANARALADHGAALLIPDAELTESRLREAVDGLLADTDRLDDMSARSKQIGRPHAAAAVADLVESHADA